MKKVQKPWGWYEIIEKKPTYWIKKIFVKKGETLSLQSHNKRSETWIVLTGTIKAQKGKKIYTLKEGKNITIEKREKHRIHGVTDSHVLEIALGQPREHDIIRYEDVYGRNI